jgi:NADPH:quinone reductase-like Zn-dependent oxidoreductase
MGIVSGGGQAEKLRIHERLCLRIPPDELRRCGRRSRSVPHRLRRALPEGGLKPGEVVLLHAAGSGVGTAAAAMATVAGARVVALSRTPDKRRRLEAMGIHRVFDPATSNLAEAIRMAAGGEGVALAVDLIGASAWTLNLDVLALRGRLVLVGTMGGAKVEADLGALMRKRLTVFGTVLRSRPIEEKIELVQSFSRTMLPLLAAGRLTRSSIMVVPLRRRERPRVDGAQREFREDRPPDLVTPEALDSQDRRRRARMDAGSPVPKTREESPMHRSAHFASAFALAAAVAVAPPPRTSGRSTPRIRAPSSRSRTS